MKPDWLTLIMSSHPDGDPTRGDAVDQAEGRSHWATAKQLAHRDAASRGRPRRLHLTPMRACLLIFRGWWESGVCDG